MNIKIETSLKSTTFWVAIAAFILLMLHTFGINVVDVKYNEVFNSILGLLTLTGILNAPQTVPTVTIPITDTLTPTSAIVQPVVITDTPIAVNIDTKLTDITK